MHGSSSINSLENVLDLANRIKLEGDYKNFSKLAPPPPTILAAFELGDVVGLMDVLEWDGILTRLQAGDQQTREFLQIPHVLHALIYFSIIQKNFPASSQNNDGVMSSENLVTHDLKTKQITVACKLLCQEHSFLTPAIRKDYQELFQILWNFVKIGSVNLDNYSNNNFRTTCWARILQSLLLKLPRELCETFLSQDCDDQFIIDLIHLVTQNPPASDAVVKLFSTLGESNQLADWLRRTNFVNKLLLTGGQKIHVKLAPVIDKELQINLATTSIIFENFSVEHSVHYDDHEMAPRKSNIVTCTDPVNSNDNLGFENRTMISVDTFINSLLHHYHQNKSTLSDLFSCILEEFAQFLPCFTVRQGVPSCSDSSSLRISILIDIISNISLSTIRNLKSKDNQYILPMDLAAPLIDMASKIIVPHIDRLCLLLKCDKNHQSSLGIDRLRIAQLITALASLHEQNITNELIRCNVASILLEKMFIHKSNSLLHICIVQFFKNSLVPHLNLEDCKADSVINKEYSLSPMNILAEDILLRTNVTNRVVEMQRFSQSVENNELEGSRPEYMGHLEIIAGFIISYLEDNPNSAFEPGDDWIWYVRGPHEEFQRHLKELSITSEYFNDVDISKINDISNNEYDTALANSTTNLMGENKNDDNEAHLAKFFCQQVLNTLPDRFRKALSSISNGLDSNEFDDYDLEKGEDEADSFDNRNETNIYEEEMDFFIHLNAQLDDKEAERLGFDSAYRLAGVTNSHVKDGNHTDEDSLSNAIVFDEHGDPVYLDSEGNPIPGIPIPITGNEAFFTMAVYDSFLSDGSDYSESGESSDPDSPDLTLTHE